ncbi:hypothetical protein ABIE89_007190 [Bradyrhizobium niftali]
MITICGRFSRYNSDRNGESDRRCQKLDDTRPSHDELFGFKSKSHFLPYSNSVLIASRFLPR